MSAPVPKCPRCGSTIGGLSEGGLCPACLLAACLENRGSGSAPADEDNAADWLAEPPSAGSGALPESLRRLGDYELFEELGRGAMGVVYRARQVSLERWVAVKLLLAGPLASHEAVRRFHEEAMAAAGLQHPGIVAVHAAGVHEGQRYLVMDYVAGPSLAQLVATSPLAARRAARYLQAIAEAIQFAHEQGILHRDLKPSNVLIDAEDRPRVMDFGLARRLNTDSSLTLSGQVLGSPGYLPPEQAGEAHGLVGRASDVYSLGAMLFHLLTGRPPFVGESTAEVIRQVLENEPVSPRLLQPSVPHDLETICLKCLEKEPARRYATAHELADELGRYLNDKPICSRPVGSFGRAWRWGHRKPSQAALAVSLVVAIGLGLAGVLWQWNRTRALAVRESRERERAEQTVHRLRLETAEDFFKRNNAATGLAVLAALLRENPKDRAVAERLLWELTHRNWPLPLVEPLTHAEPVHYAEFSPDGSRILTAALDNTARLWDAATGKPLGRPLEHERGAAFHREQFTGGQKCLEAHFSPDGSMVATASVDNTARVWDGRTGEPRSPPLPHPDWVDCVRFSPDGRWLATAGRDGNVRFWEAERGAPVGPILHHEKWVAFVEFDGEGRRVLTGAQDFTAQVWEVATGKPVGERIRHQGEVRAGQFSPNGRRVATASADGTARIWDAAAGTPVTPPLHHEGVVCGVQFSPDGAWLATASFDQTVRLWDAETGAALARPLDHGGSLRSMQFSPEGRRLVTAAEDRTVRVWDFRTGELVLEPIRHTAKVWSARFSPDGQRVVTASSDMTCGVWEVRPGSALTMELPTLRVARNIRWSPDGQKLLSTGALPRLFVQSNGWALVGDLWSDARVNSAEFSADGRWIVTGSGDGGARIWDAAKWEVRLRVRHVGAVVSACVSRDGQRLLTASTDTLAALWSTESGRQLRTFSHPDRLEHAEFSPDAKRILTLCADQKVRLWDATNGQLVVAWQPHAATVHQAHFSPDGNRVVTGSLDHAARVWDAATGRSLCEPLAHRGAVRSARLSPDGGKLLTASQDDTAVIWDLTSPQPRSIMLQHGASLHSARFSPNGRRVVTACQDRTARVWDAVTGQPLGSPIQHSAPVLDAAFSPDGNWIATASGRSVWVWPVARSGVAASDWLADLAEAVAGVRQTAELGFETISPTRFLEHKQRHERSRPTRREADWLEWFLADRANRPVAPEADFTLPQVVAREEAKAHWGRFSGASLVKPLIMLHPTNGWLFAQVAHLSLEDYAQRSDPRWLRETDWLTERALVLAPNHPAVWWTRASYLSYAGNPAGTLEAIAQAESLPNASSRLSLARAQWLESNWREDRCRPETVLAAYRRAIEGRAEAQLDANEMRLAWLACAGVEASLGNRQAARAARCRAYGLNLRSRAADTPAKLIDLTDFYTASPDADWRSSRFPGHDLSALPGGRQVLEGIEYDVRGLVQLSSARLKSRLLEYPEYVRGIPVQQSCRRIHFLHAADTPANPLETVARYAVHWSDGREEQIPIRYAVEALPWDWEPPPGTAQPVVAWHGTSPAGHPVWLFRTTWTNTHPDVPVANLDLSSTMTACGMFIVAITAE